MALVMTTDYTAFPTLTPTESNRAVGGVATDDRIFCRSCIERLHKNWADLKYITRTQATHNAYNCIECGFLLSKKRMSKFD
jgi:hypothetical protein